MAEDKGKEEEKFDFTAEGEGYISLAEARVLAVRTAVETPGDYSRDFRRLTMVFEVVESGEDDDYYNITLSFRPQGSFAGSPGQEQFVIGKEGTIALRQVLSSPIGKGGGFPILPVSIGLLVVGAIAAAGTVFVMMGSGGDSVPIAALPPTETPAPAETLAAPTQPLASTETLAPPPPTFTPMPTYTPYPTPTPRPTSRPTATIQPGSAITGQNCVVTAWIDGSQVASTNVTGGEYNLLIEQGEQSFVGKLIRFKIGGVEAQQTSTWQQGGGDVLNLTVGSSRRSTPTRSSLDTSQFKNWPIGLMTQRTPPHVFEGTATPCSTLTPYPTATPFPIPSCSDLEGPPNYSIIIDQGDKSFAGKTVSFTVGGYAAGTVNWSQGGTSNVDLEAITGRTGLPNSSIRNIPISVSGQRVPPNVFVGTAFLDCGLAPVGTKVSAWVDGEIVGTSWVENIESGSVLPCRTTSNQSSPCEVFYNFIRQDNLVAVWKFSNATRSWSFYVPDDAFFGVNNLTMVAGDIVWVNVTAEQAFQSTTLFPGWNLISLN